MVRSTAAVTTALVVSVLVGCATPPVACHKADFHGVTAQDVREIELLVSRRPDILKPVLSVDRLSTGRIEVRAGRDQHLGDNSDTFTVAKRHGRWTITSAIQHESVIVLNGKFL